MKKYKNIMSESSPWVSGSIMLLVIIVGLAAIFVYTEQNKQQVLTALKFKTSQLADIKVNEIKNKINQRISQIKNLSLNATLSLYLSMYQNSNSDDIALSALQGYVKNLLQAHALHYGFLESSVQSNKIYLSAGRNYGMILLDKNNNFIMSTKGLLKNINKYEGVIEKAYITGKTQIIGLYQGQKKQPVYGFIAPISKIQGQSARQFSGVVIMLLDARKDFFDRGEYPQKLNDANENFLLRHERNKLIYIRSAQNEIKVVNQNFDQSLIARYYFQSELANGDVFMSDKGVPVVLVRRQITEDLWLIKKISVEDALNAVNNNQFFVSTVFMLLVVMIGLIVQLVRVRKSNLKWLSLYAGLEKRNKLLEMVSNNIKDKIIILNNKDKVIFMNNAFSQALPIESVEFQDKNVRQVLGVELADLIISHKQLEEAVTLPFKQGCQPHYIILSERLLMGDSHIRMFILSDLSEFNQEQSKSESRNKSVINAIINAVDAYDPYCEKHSERTCEVALAIAEGMNLSGSQLASLEVASILANIGKLHVPKQILIKKQVLTSAETRRLQKHVEFAVNMLAEIEFEGPVLDIIAQKNEYLDGSGYPKGLSQQEIMIESRILAVANAFVAMVSPRAYRQGREINEVLRVLLVQAESQYDGQVVAALFHVCENKKDWNDWQVV